MTSNDILDLIESFNCRNCGHAPRSHFAKTGRCLFSANTAYDHPAEEMDWSTVASIWAVERFENSSPTT